MTTKRLAPYGILFLITCGFFWQFVLLGRIPIDVSPLYRMRPWSQSPQAAKLAHDHDPARYYHNVDPIIEVFPIKRWMAQHLRNGDVPLWTPALFSGAPFAANHHAAPWDPSSLLFILLPADIAFAVTLFLHLWIAGACTYFYCRTVDCSGIASLLAACAFMFNSFFLHWLGLISFNAGLIWMPLIPAGIELALRRKNYRYLSLTASALGLSFLSGMAQFWLFNLLILFTYGAYRMFTIPELRTHRTRWLAWVFAFTLLGFGIGAVQLYQTVFAYTHTSRGGSHLASPYAGRNHLSPRKLVTLAIPNFYGHHQENVFSKLLLNPADPLAAGVAGRLVWGEKGAIFHRSWGYIGLIALLFMIVGCIQAPPPHRFFLWLVAGVLGFQILLCWPAFHRLCRAMMPAFDTLDHTRTIAMFSFAGAVLAARGIDSVRREVLRKLRRLLFAGAVLCGVMIVLLHLQPIDVEKRIRSMKNPRPDLYAAEFFADAVPKISSGIRQSAQIFYFPLFTVVSVLLLISLFMKERLSQSGFRIALLVISVIDMYHRGWNDPELVYARRSALLPPESTVQEFLRRDPGEFRIFEVHRKRPLPQTPLTNYSELERVRKGSIRFFDPLSVEFVFRPNTLMHSGVWSAGGYMSLYPGRYKDLWDGRGMDILKAFKPGESAEMWNESWIGMQGIKYVLVPDDVDTGSWNPVFRAEGVQVLQVDTYAPLIRAVTESKEFTETSELLSYLRKSDFDPNRVVLLELPETAKRPESRIDLQMVSRTPDTMQFKARLSSEGYVVISENLFPGWSAVVNGREQRLLHANYAFSALQLPEGSHDVALRFEPPLYKLTLGISILSLTLTLGIFVLRRRRG